VADTVSTTEPLQLSPVGQQTAAWVWVGGAIEAAFAQTACQVLYAWPSLGRWTFSPSFDGVSVEGALAGWDAEELGAECREALRSGELRSFAPRGSDALGLVQILPWLGVRPCVITMSYPSAEIATFEAPLRLLRALLNESRLAEQGEVFHSLAGDTGFIVDADMRIVVAPAEATRLTGASLGVSHHGRSLHDLVSGWHVRSLETGEVARGFLPGLKRGFTAYHLGDDDAGRALHAVRFRSPEARGVQRRYQLAFLSTLRHDLRSPLTALRGLVSVLIDEPEMSPEERGELLEMLRQEAERLVSFVEEYLVIMRLRIDPRPQKVQRCDARGALMQYLVELEGHAESRGIQLKTHLGEADVEAEAPLLEVFLRSVVGAFFRMADKGAVIAVSIDAGHLRVSATGPGLFRQLLERPFTALSRSTSSGKRTPGAALGFFLAKRIADAHGWTIAFSESEEGVEVAIAWGQGAA